MTERHEIGGNKPPADADPLKEKLEEQNAELLDKAGDLELRSFSLPELVNTEEDAAAVADFVAEAKRFARAVEEKRVEEKVPYLAGTRSVDSFFNGIGAPVEQRITLLTGRINAYQKAKAERERAEQRERERLAREEADKAEAARRAAEAAARKAAEDAAAAAATMRSAADADARKAAEEQMREAEQARLAAGRLAEEQAEAQASAERIAEQSARAAAGPVGKLAKVTAGGASVGATSFWNHEVTDEAALILSLGQLGPYFTQDSVRAALASFKREHTRLGTIETAALPGVRFFSDTRTNIRNAT